MVIIMRTVDDPKNPINKLNNNSHSMNDINTSNNMNIAANNVENTTNAVENNKKTPEKIINIKPLEKVITFLATHYGNDVKHFAEEDNFQAKTPIRINLHNAITQLASDIIEYKKFADIKISELSDEQLSIFITPIGTLVNLEINILLFFVIRDLCEIQGFDEITQPLITSMNTGQIYEFLGECNKNISLLTDSNLKKDIDRYIKNLFYNNIPDHIKQRPGTFEYYFNILNFISLGSHTPEVFQKQASKILVKHNSFYSKPTIKVYEIEWTNGKDSFTQECIEYPNEDTIVINNEKYTIKNINTKIAPKESYIVDVYIVQPANNTTHTNLDELVANTIHSSSNIKNELALRRWRLISSSSTMSSESNYTALLKRGYFISAKPNKTYEILINPRPSIETARNKDVNINETKGNIDSTIKMSSYIQ